MALEAASPEDDAQAPLHGGRLYWLRAGRLEVALAPDAGGRIAQMRYDGVDWLVGEDEGEAAAIGWGCYPMVPWAGRIRRGRFVFDGKAFELPPNLGAHAIHGVGFSRPWRIENLGADTATLSLALPEDGYWPFGGRATQAIHVLPDRLKLRLAVQAGDKAMPAVLGWHPWFRKPDQLLFSPSAMYPRDGEGIATLPRATPAPATGPFDDCFINKAEVVLVSGAQRLELRADSEHWVVYDGTAHATCVEPQTGPPDGFTLAPKPLESGQMLELRFELLWCNASAPRPE
ncbi:aldose 1-epimerase [Stenotrophomonas rhizophila]|uniref:aldose epimerase family protein n=1 Tax=Stenotrophomonas rhizophila TaxID=216778 RepID=UPI000F4CC71B|nr:aldose epimerase [Stenotrophomonas rhizophila]ROP80228.1 aldose 1-epimerase [Stenotrophomonas rhizophila]